MDDEKSRWKWRLIGLGGGVAFSLLAWALAIWAARALLR